MTKADLEIVYAFIILSLVLILAASCATVYPRNELVNQIVRFRDNSNHLTNSICKKKYWYGGCQEYDLKEYDLNDPVVRETFVKLGFVCSLGGKRYKIDPDQPGFVRYKFIDGGWFKKDRVEKVGFIPYSETQFLKDSATECWSERTYPNGIH